MLQILLIFFAYLFQNDAKRKDILKALGVIGESLLNIKHDLFAFDNCSI